MTLGLLTSAFNIYAAKSAGSAARDSADASALGNDDSDYGSRFGGLNLYLQVFINGGSQGRFAHFRLRGSELWASHYALRRLGLILPPGTPDPVALQSLPGVRVDYDAAAQRVSIVAPLSMLNLATTHLSNLSEGEPTPTVSPGVLFNYDLYGTHGAKGGNSLNAFTELRAFGGIGVFDTTNTVQRQADGGWHAVRLDTSWRASFPNAMLDLTVGDTLTGALPWTRSTRIGGIRIGTDFALQPYRITTPLQAFLGQATLPSQVELYVNGMKAYHGQVPAGDVRLTTSPPSVGLGNARMVLTNALGQSTIRNFSFYNTSALLAPGLSNWSASLGVVRRNYGLNSFDYGHEPLLSASARYGVTDHFTGAAHTEAINGLWNASIGGVWLAGLAGVVNASIAESDNRGVHGTQYGLGYSWNNRHFSLSFGALGTQGDYADIATRYGIGPPRLSSHASLGFSTRRAGSFSLSYIQLHYPDQDTSRYASLGWTASFGGTASVSLFANRNLEDGRDTSVTLNLGLYFGNNYQAYASVNHQSGHTGYSVGASRLMPGGVGGFGWQVQANHDEFGNGGNAQLGYLGQYGRYAGGIIVNDGNTNAYADASGSLVFMNGDLFATRQVYNGFAVVSTGGIAGVPVTLENNVIGKTDSKGMFLVPRLNAWQRNQIGIAPLNLPPDVRIPQTTLNATPRDRSGTLVRFKLKKVRAATIILVDAAGEPLALGSHVRLKRQPDRGDIVGYGGETYLDTLHKHNTLEITTPKGKTCRVNFDYHGEKGTIPQIGPLACKLRARP